MNAKVEVLWIAEVEPDKFSRLIMWKMNRPYSHCEIPILIDEPEYIANAGCRIVYKKDFELICSVDVFQAELEGERGKGYGTWQNWGIVFPWLRHLLRNGDALRNCSEFVACKVNKYLPYDSSYILTGDLDWYSPKDLEDAWAPDAF